MPTLVQLVGTPHDHSSSTVRPVFIRINVEQLGKPEDAAVYLRFNAHATTCAFGAGERYR
jgi:hypothetical protein